MSKLLAREFKSLYLGDKIGRGAGRSVYEMRLDASVVIKIEQASRSFQNVEEYACWNWVQGSPMERWFAPCVSISAAGMILIQRRVTPLRPGERPDKLPAFLCDLKSENFGIFEGRVVCCDYGTVLSSITTANKRLVRAKWRS